jgi:hypothetical protein
MARQPTTKPANGDDAAGHPNHPDAANPPPAGVESGGEAPVLLPGDTDVDNTAFHAPPVVYTESAMSTNLIRGPHGEQLKVRKRVSIPSLEFLPNMTIVVRVLDGIIQGKVFREPKPGRAVMEPGFCCTVSSLGGEHRTLWTGAVLRKELEEQYPNDGYVGAWFHITRLPKKVSKESGFEYSPFIITEIEPPTEAEVRESVRLAQREAVVAPRLEVGVSSLGAPNGREQVLARLALMLAELNVMPAELFDVAYPMIRVMFRSNVTGEVVRLVVGIEPVSIDPGEAPD